MTKIAFYPTKIRALAAVPENCQDEIRVKKVRQGWIVMRLVNSSQQIWRVMLEGGGWGRWE